MVFRLVELFNSPKSSTDLKDKCQTALKLCLQNCLITSALEPLLYVAPPEILKYVLGQYSKVSTFFVVLNAKRNNTRAVSSWIAVFEKWNSIYFQIIKLLILNSI